MSDFTGVKIALLYNNQLLMIQRDNKPGLRFAGLWDFPGGGREANESPEECAIREIHEELAIKLIPERFIYKKIHPAMHDQTLNAYFLVAELTSDDIENIKFGNEGQGWRLFSSEEFANSKEVVLPLKGRFSEYLNSLS